MNRILTADDATVVRAEILGAQLIANRGRSVHVAALIAFVIVHALTYT